MITKEVIQNKFNELIGTKFCTYEIFRAVQNLFGEKDRFNLTWDSSKYGYNRMFIKWKGYSIISIEYHKKKDYSNKWFFKEITFKFTNYTGSEEKLKEINDLDTIIVLAELQKNKSIQERHQKLDTLSEQFQQIQKLFGLGKRDTHWLLHDIVDNYYSFSDKIEGE